MASSRPKNSAARLEGWYVSVASALCCLLFLRPSLDAFDLPKATSIWIFGALGLPLIVAVRSGSSWRNPEVAPIWLFAIMALAVSLVAADEKALTLVGTTGRYTGGLTLVSLAVLAQMATGLDPRQRRNTYWVLVVSTLVGNIYGWIQLAGFDPFEWTQRSSKRSIFGTFGNSNMMSAWSAVVVVLTCGMLAWARPWSRWQRSVLWSSALFTIGMIGAYRALQGSIGLVVLVPFGVVIAGRRVGNRAWGRLAGACAGAVLLLLSTVEWGAIAVVALAIIGAGVPFVERSIFELLGRRSGNFVLVGAVSGAALMIGGLLVARPATVESISKSVGDGFATRGDYYRTAWTAFRSRPLLGFGLDSFGRIFTTYRPPSNAANYERVLTNSAHSVPLGILVSGGLVLLSTFVLLVAWVFWRFTRGIRNTGNGDEAIVLGTSFVALIIIFLGTVENVGLFLLFFLLAGMISRVSQPADGNTTSSISRRSSSRALRLGSFTIASVALLLAPIPLVASIRADQGLRSMVSENFDVAEVQLHSASRLAPWDPTYKRLYAETLVRVGRVDEGARQATRSVEIENYPMETTLRAALFQSASGHVQEAVDLLEMSIERNPNSPKGLEGFRTLLTDIKNALDQQGRVGQFPEVDRLIDRIDRELSLIRDNE